MSEHKKSDDSGCAVPVAFMTFLWWAIGAGAIGFYVYERTGDSFTAASQGLFWPFTLIAVVLDYIESMPLGAM